MNRCQTCQFAAASDSHRDPRRGQRGLLCRTLTKQEYVLNTLTQPQIAITNPPALALAPKFRRGDFCAALELAPKFLPAGRLEKKIKTVRKHTENTRCVDFP